MDGLCACGRPAWRNTTETLRIVTWQSIDGTMGGRPSSPAVEAVGPNPTDRGKKRHQAQFAGRRDWRPASPLPIVSGANRHSDAETAGPDLDGIVWCAAQTHHSPQPSTCKPTRLSTKARCQGAARHTPHVRQIRDEARAKRRVGNLARRCGHCRAQSLPGSTASESS